MAATILNVPNQEKTTINKPIRTEHKHLLLVCCDIVYKTMKVITDKTTARA